MAGEGKVALVTGAGTGIGKAAALAMLADGYRVGMVGRREDMLRAAATESGAGSRALVLPADVTDAAAVRGVFGRLHE